MCLIIDGSTDRWACTNIQHRQSQVLMRFVYINRAPRPGVLFLGSLPLGVIILTMPGSRLERGEACRDVS